MPAAEQCRTSSMFSDPLAVARFGRLNPDDLRERRYVLSTEELTNAVPDHPRR
jgi:hypothetical protein